MIRRRSSAESAAGFLAAQAAKRARAETAAYHRKRERDTLGMRVSRERDTRWRRFCLMWHQIGYEIASNPLAPRWMTPAEIADLVARARLMPEDGPPSGIIAVSSSHDDALYVQQLYRDTRWPHSHIAALVGRSEAWVTAMLKVLSNATPALLEHWRRGALTEEQVRSIGTIEDPARQGDVATRVAELRDRGAISAARSLALEYAPTRWRR